MKKILNLANLMTLLDYIFCSHGFSRKAFTQETIYCAFKAALRDSAHTLSAKVC